MSGSSYNEVPIQNKNQSVILPIRHQTADGRVMKSSGQTTKAHKPPATVRSRVACGRDADDPVANHTYCCDGCVDVVETIDIIGVSKGRRALRVADMFEPPSKAGSKRRSRGWPAQQDGGRLGRFRRELDRGRFTGRRDLLLVPRLTATMRPIRSFKSLLAARRYFGARSLPLRSRAMNAIRMRWEIL
jgi:hypothetical protein